jgi:hypothetical protein
MVATGGSGTADARSIFRLPLIHPRRRVRGVSRQLVYARTVGAIDCRIAYDAFLPIDRKCSYEISS